MSEHDDFCEAEYVNGAGGYTSCSCDYRRTRGLVAEHHRQVAERAWYKGHSTGIFDKQYETGTRNPYTRKEQS